ncbi:hypothetical protein [Halobacterium wangiae]|uniref:hypothetical protein n=1 Tax=Halobacterium wangiae TaxID=2902623 RepID=UPI001E51D719|nr:hypothetical protein [Halobacterium wangiae]
MIEGLDADLEDTDAVREHRDEVVEQVRQHAGQAARELARLRGGDYGRESFRTDGGEWTLKYEAGDIEFLRFEGQAGVDVYVVSTQQPPEPEPLATAMAHYADFVASFNDYVRGLDGVLDDVPTEFPAVEAGESVVEARDAIVARIRGAANEMAATLYRVENTEYGSFAAPVDGTRWELKRDADRVSYVRVGGEGGVYLVSQYGAPSARDVRAYAEDFGDFVAAFNEDVADLGADLDDVSL